MNKFFAFAMFVLLALSTSAQAQNKPLCWSDPEGPGLMTRIFCPPGIPADTVIKQGGGVVASPNQGQKPPRTQQNRDLNTGNVLNFETRVIFMDSRALYPELAAKRLQTAARKALRDPQLTVVTEEPESEKVSFQKVEFSTSEELVDDRQRDNVLFEILERSTGGRSGAAGLILDEVLNVTGISGQHVTEYYYQEFSLKLGSNPLRYSGYVYFKIVAYRDRYGAVTIRSLESMGDEESCWVPEDTKQLFPNFRGKKELLALDVALRQAAFTSWIRGEAPHYNAPANENDPLKKKRDPKRVGKCTTR